jgi:Neprosin
MNRVRAAIIAATLLAGLLIATPAHAALTYFYAGFKMTATTNGVAGNATIANPTVTSGDFHSLAEFAVSTTNQQQALEVGWTVDNGTFGDNLTHLFVGRWVNGVFGGYNAGGWVDNGANPVNAGAALTADVGLSKAFGILHSGTNWWLYYNNVAIGSYPDSLWSGTFTTGSLNQAFGEVAANVASPTTKMGNGDCPTATLGARFTSLTNQGGPTFSGTAFATDTTKYNYFSLSTRSLAYGGDGSC